ncbi:RNA polymerase sigma factor [Streptomyces sp. NPDC101062]|uniref:RNA polymerase sigma factor n=1 Tax=unclassified Streptomyces TaxID=2593676 RepID=UPI002E76016D|nr:sigma-70 family RNA polymerase sigma factor [Streptomyces sp. JV176]MEE1798489.1 sigma-70 family RNA polymerase sigma factor [Streptomyces sp. JV176]
MPGNGNELSARAPDQVLEQGRSDDGLLAVRAGEGDEEAFETLVRRHSPVMLQLATRLLGSRTEAEDAVQDAFVSAWRKLPEFRGASAFRTWMYRIVTNRCLNQLRARRPATDLDSVPEPAAPEHQSSPARVAESHAATRALAVAMAGLSPEQRACWVLRELHGMSYENIAETVGISLQAVRGRVFRARRYLTEAMSAWR